MPNPKSKTKRLLLWFAGVLLAAVLWAAGEYVYWTAVDHRFTTLAAERLHHSAAMPPADLVARVRAQGIDTVIDFRDDEPEAVAAEAAALTAAGIRHIHYPSPQVPSRETIAGFLTTLRRELEADREVLLHCHHGEGRAPLYGALYRIEFEGWKPEDALASLVRLPPRLLFLQTLLPGLGQLSGNNPKRALLLEYEPRNGVPPAGS